MASIFSKIGEVFKKRNSTPAAQETAPTQVAPAAGSSNSTTPAGNVFKPSMTMTAQKGSSGKKETVDVGFKPIPISYEEFSPSSKKAPTSIDWRSLSDRSKANDAANGIDWSNASARQKQYNDTYYKTLDDPTHTKMYRDLETASRYGKDATKEYRANRDALDDELDKIAKEKGKSSDEYRALQKFVDDYTELGRKMVSGYTKKASEKVSQQADDTIDSIFSGVQNRTDYQQKVAEGKKGLDGDLILRLRYNLDAASEKQRDMMYYVYATEGKDAAREFFDRFIGESINYQKAAKDFADDIANDSKLARFWQADVANAGAAFAGQIGTGLRQTFTDTKVDPNDRTILGNYSINDSIDDYLRQQVGDNIKDSTLKEYGTAGFAELQDKVDKDWIKDATQNASEYQKQFLGYLYLATGSKKEAREAWESLKQRGDVIWKTVNGKGTVAASAASMEGQMYRDYLGLGSKDTPSWLGKTSQDEELTVAQAVWDAAMTTRAQYPQIAANIIGSGLTGNPMVGRVLGAAVMSIPAYGNEYKQAVDEGKSPKAAAGFAATQALMEFGSDYLLSGIAPIVGSLTNDLGLKFVKSISNPFLRALANSGVRALGEGAQEYIQEIATNPIRNLWFGEQNAFEPISEEAAYNFFLGAISAFLMGPTNTMAETRLNTNFTKIGEALNGQNSTEKLVDTVLNNPVEGGTKEQQELYEEAAKLAKHLKDGSVKPTDVNVGEVFGKYAKAGGDTSFLDNPGTVAYNKDSIALEDMIAGANSMLHTLNGDVGLAESVAKLAMGQPITTEMQEAINKSTEAQQVLTQLQGDLDMSVDNALSRAARATIFKGSINKIYSTLKNSNPEKNVVSPAVQTLYDSGVKIKEAEKIGAVFNKVLDGQKVSEKEAKLVRANSPAIRAAALQILGLDLSEYAGADMVRAQLNELAGQQQTVKEQQADVKRSMKVVARARGAAMQGGFTNGQSGLRQADTGRPAGVPENGVGAGLQGQVPGAAPEGSGSNPTSGRAPASGNRSEQRSRAGAARNEDVRARVIPDKELDEGQKRLQEALVSRGFDVVEFVVGQDSCCGWDPVRGVYVCQIRVNGQFGQNQYADHESLHLWLDALDPEAKKALLFKVISDIYGENTAKPFSFLYDLYNGKGYFLGKTELERTWQVFEDMLCFAYGGQNFQGIFDFSAYQEAVRSWVEENNLRAIGMGDTSNPAVQEAIKADRINKEYYDRHGYLQSDSTEIDVGTAPETTAQPETRAEEARTPTANEQAIRNADAEDLKRSVKNLRKERKRLIREAEQNGTRNTQSHRDVINALNEQIEEYQSRIDDLAQHSADYEEENYGENQGTAGDRGLQEESGRAEQQKVVGVHEVRKSPEQRAASREEHERVKAGIVRHKGRILELHEIPDDYLFMERRLASAAPDSDIDYYYDANDEDDMFFAPGDDKDTDGGFFINVATLDSGDYKAIGKTLDGIVKHDAGHYYLSRADRSGADVWSYLMRELKTDPRTILGLTNILSIYRQVYPNKTNAKQMEEVVNELFSGYRRIFDAKAPGVFDKAQPLVEKWFLENTAYNPDNFNHSADYDPEYFQSIGLINQDGTTASFTDNIGGVHEEILNQLHGTEGEDIKDFIARGGVRVKPGVGIEVNGDIEPTFKQYDVIDNVVRYFTGKTFSIDFNIKGTAAGTHTFEGFDIDPSRIYSYLRNYYQKRKASVLDRYATILGMPVKTLKDAYNVAKFQLQMEGNDPELQEIIDAYENRRYSADYDVEKFAEDFDTNEYLNETTELELDGFEIEGADSDIDEYVMAGGPTDLAGAPITNDVRNFFGRAQSYDKRTYEVVNGIIPLYLATDNLGFSAYDPAGKSDDGRSIFLTDNRAVGATYGKKGDNLIDMKALGALREHIASELGYKDFDDLPLPTTLAEDRSEDSIRLLYKMYNALLSYKGKTPWIKNKGKLLPVQVRSKLSNLRTSFPQINDLADEANYIELRLRKADPDSVITEALLSTVATVKEKIQSLLKANEASNADISELLNLILKCRNVIDDTAAKLGTSDEISDKTRMEVLAALGMVDAVVNSSATSLADALADGVFFPVTDTAGNRVEVSEVLNALADSGSWAVYANTTNPLVVWGEGSWWSDLADAIAGEEWEEDFWEWYDNYEYKDFDLIHPHINTRAIANYAYERGYDSAIMIDVHDKGGYRTKLPGGGKQPSTIYVVFNPNQIKSVNNKHPSQDRRMNYSADYDVDEEFDEQLARNARNSNVFSNDLWEVSDENPEDALTAEYDALFAELDAFPEREAEIMAKIGALQNKNMIRTANTDDITTEEQNAPQEDKYKEVVDSGAKTEKLKSPVQMAFQPKKDVAPVEEAKPEPKAEEKKPLKAMPIPKAAPQPEPKAEEKKPLKVKPIPKAQPKPVDNGVTPDERSAYEQLKAELEANPELANDPAILARAAALVPKMARQMTATAEKVAQLEAQEAEAQAAEETATEDVKTVTRVEDTTTKFTRKDKGGNWWKNIGRSDTIEIRRRRSDRNAFDVRITDAKGNTVVYDDVSPAMLTKAFGVKTNDRKQAMERTKRATALAQNVSLSWSKFDNPVVEKAPAKPKPNRSKDNLGRSVPAQLSQYMDKSAIRTEDGALINTYRLAAENGVHNAKAPGRFSMFTERPASMNIQRGMTGAAAYGQSEKAAGEKLAAIFDKLADPTTSESEVKKLRSQIAQLEEQNKKYFSGITRLDPTRPGFQFAQRENVVNGKSVLETYLDIRKPKVIDAQGQGLDFVQREVRKFINDPANKAGIFDNNRDPVGPNDGFKFTNVNVVPEGQTLGGGERDLDTVYVTFRNNQAKSTYNTNPTTSDLLQYSADYDAKVEEDAVKKGILEKKPTGFTDAKGYSISSDQAWLFDEAKMLDKDGRLVKGILPLYGGSKGMHLMWDPGKARKTKALYLATNPRVSEGYTKVPEGQGKVADLMAYEQLVEKLANSVRMNADTLAERIPALRKFAAGTDNYANEGARRLVVMYNNAITKDNPMRGKAELIPTDGTEPPRVKFADGTTVAAADIPNFLPTANIRMFYANTKNPFVIYGNHANWRHIYMGNNKAFMDWKKRVWDQPGYEEFQMKPDATYVDTDTIVQYVLEETPNDSVIFHDIMDAIGKHPDGYGDVYVVFNPDQAKSVNNRHPTLDPRYNHSADYDAKVFKDMEDRGIIEKGRSGHHDLDGNYISPVQASFFDKAKSLDRNGALVYGVIPLFHGGRSIYLVWDPSKAKDAEAIFLATNPATSETYMAGSKQQLGPGKMVDLMKHEAILSELTDRLGLGPRPDQAIDKLVRDIKYGSPKEKAEAAKTYAEIYNATVGQEYGKITPVESDAVSQLEQILGVMLDDQYKLGDLLADLEDVMDNMTDSDTRQKLQEFDDLANDLYFAVDKLRTTDNLDWNSSYRAANLARQVAKAEPIINPETGEILNWRLQEQAKRITDQINTLDDFVMGNKEDVQFENEGMDGFWSTIDDLPIILPGTGVSAFYANTTNPLVVDGTVLDAVDRSEVPGEWDAIDVSRNPELLKAFPDGYAATDEIAKYALAHNYDSVIIHNIYDLAGRPNDGDGSGDIYIVFNSNQIKSVNNRFPTLDPRYNHSADYTDVDTGYEDGSLEDTLLKILWDKDEDRAAAALAEFFFQFVQTGNLPQMENERTRNIFQPRVTPGEAKVIDDQFKQFIKEFGALEKGVNPARDVSFPKQTDTGYARRFFRTAAESKNTPEWTMDALKREFLLDSGTYQRMTDKAAIAYADRELARKGYDKVLAEWQGKIDAESRLTKNDVAVGETLLNEALNAGDMETAMRLIAELAEVGTTAGQTVQAFSMLKKMPKSYQLYYFQRVANRLNRQYAKRFMNGEQIKIDSKYAKAVLNAKTKEELDAAIDALIRSIADQVPVNTADKWNAWRYLSMLGNPKTHIRNVLGNAIFAPAKFAKDLVAAGLESTLIKDPNKRTTSFKGLLDRKGTAEYRKFAETDYDGIKQELQSGGKYNPTNAVMEARTIFKNSQLEKLRRLNGEWLEKEDGAFLKFHYVNALTNFLATKGVSIEELQGTREGKAILNAARQYAFLEAQKATYRDASAVAAALNQLKRAPGIGVLLEGLLPFAKTPINILKRGIEYSPIGLLDATTRQLAKLKNGDITANEFVDHLASGLTGTGIAILGFWLASQGLLRGGDDDDDKQADADKLVGYQNYSINLGNTNYTIDWMAPSALPLFVGAAVFNELREKNGLSGADFYNALTVIAEPITQLSMLSGLNDTLKSAKRDDNPFASVIQSMGAGYISQGLPTWAGQWARTFTEDRRTTYVDKNSDIPQPIQRWVQTNVMGKIPGLNNQRPEYIDAWGRKDTTQSFLLRLFDNMLSPGYRNEIENTAVDKELQRLADKVGTGVLMSPANRYIEFNNENHNLTADQYEKYAKVRGNSTFSMLTELFNSDAYADLSDEEKAKAVQTMKEYGNILGKQAVFPEYETDDDNWAAKCDGDPTRLVDTALIKGVASEKGIAVRNSGEFYKLVINTDWLTPTEQAYIMGQQYTTTSKNVYVSRSSHKYDLTPERKEVLYKHVRDIYPAYYTELVESKAWKKASDSKRMDLLKSMRDQISKDAKVWLARQLEKAGER